MSDYVVEKTCAACPLQFEGTVDGYPLYFRLRWGWWSFTIAENSAVWPSDDEEYYERRGAYGDDLTGIMSDEDALAIIDRCVAEFRKTGFDD